MEILENINATHPFMPLIDNEPNNPQLLIVNRYLAMLQTNQLADVGICTNCISNDLLPEDIWKKDHSNHLS
jgi:hypothetical protein